MAQWLLRRWVDPIVQDMALGDLEEQFFYDEKAFGRRAAQQFYWRNTIAAGQEWGKGHLNWRSLMFSNDVKIGLRHLKGNRMNTIINVLGLSIAMGWAVLVLSYVQNEFQFDRFHRDIDRLALVYNSWTNGDFWASMDAQAPLGPALTAEHLEFDGAVRLVKKDGVLRQGERVEPLSVLGTDHSFFDLFTFPLRYGSTDAFENSPNSIYLSRRKARQLFGNDVPLGLTVDVQIHEAFVTFEVAGVFETLPSASSLRFECVIPIVHLLGEELQNWKNVDAPTVVRLAPNVKMAQIVKSFPALVKPRLAVMQDEEHFHYKLVPFKSYHHQAARNFTGFEPMGNASAIWLLTGIAVLVLLIASMNYVNLALGGSATKMKQVGIRKVLGADKRQVIRLFLTETVVLLAIALVLGLLLAKLMLPVFRQMTGKPLLGLPLASLTVWGALLLLLGGIALIAGGYPALTLSGVQPISLFNGRVRFFRKRKLSAGLIVFQFTVSVFMICAMIVVLKQHRFMLARHFGSQMNQVVEVDVNGAVGEPAAIQGRIRALRTQLKSLNGIDGVCGAQASVFYTMATIAKTEKGPQLFCFNYVDANYIDLMGFHLIAGEPPRANRDQQAAYVTPSILQKCVEGDREVLGLTLNQLLGRLGEIPIQGQLDDFYVQTLKRAQSPHIVIVDENAEFGVLYARLDPDRRGETLAAIRREFAKIFPDLPFQYSFVDEKAASTYKEESRWSLIVKATAAVALFIALSGLYGLTLMAIVRRNKEISIRKVLGASHWHVQREVQHEFLGYVLLGNLMACPAIYFVMNRWLQDFSHRTTIAWWVYLMGIVMTLAVALITVGWQGVRVTRSNPLLYLRNE